MVKKFIFCATLIVFAQLFWTYAIPHWHYKEVNIRINTISGDYYLYDSNKFKWVNLTKQKIEESKRLTQQAKNYK